MHLAGRQPGWAVYGEGETAESVIWSIAVQLKQEGGKERRRKRHERECFIIYECCGTADRHHVLLDLLYHQTRPTKKYLWMQFKNNNRTAARPYPISQHMLAYLLQFFFLLSNLGWRFSLRFSKFSIPHTRRIAYESVYASGLETSTTWSVGRTLLCSTLRVGTSAPHTSQIYTVHNHRTFRTLSRIILYIYYILWDAGLHHERGCCRRQGSHSPCQQCIRYVVAHKGHNLVPTML